MGVERRAEMVPLSMQFSRGLNELICEGSLVWFTTQHDVSTSKSCLSFGYPNSMLVQPCKFTHGCHSHA